VKTPWIPKSQWIAQKKEERRLERNAKRRATYALRKRIREEEKAREIAMTPKHYESVQDSIQRKMDFLGECEYWMSPARVKCVVRHQSIELSLIFGPSIGSDCSRLIAQYAYTAPKFSGIFALMCSDKIFESAYYGQVLALREPIPRYGLPKEISFKEDQHIRAKKRELLKWRFIFQEKGLYIKKNRAEKCSQGLVVLQYPKHRGRTLAEVALIDPQYLRFLYDEVVDKNDPLYAQMEFVIYRSGLVFK
jgi:hypothetical protein